MAFDPDAFLAEPFDPDAFLSSGASLPQATRRQSVVSDVPQVSADGSLLPQAPYERTAYPKERAYQPSGFDYVKQAASGINQGLLDIPELPANLANAALSLTPFEGRVGSLKETPIIGDFLTAATKRAIPEGTNAVSDALRVGGEWTSPTGALTKVDKLMAGGAVIGDYLNDTFGEIAGGVLAPIIGSFTGKKAKGLTRDQKKVLEFVKANTGDLNEAQGKVIDAIERGDIGDLADLSGDNQLKRVVAEFGADLGQESMFFERTGAMVEFLPPQPRKGSS